MSATIRKHPHQITFPYFIPHHKGKPSNYLMVLSSYDFNYTKLFFTPVKIFFLRDNIHVKYATKIAQEYNVIKTYLNTGKTQIININFQPHQLHRIISQNSVELVCSYTNAPSHSKSIWLF